MDRYGNPNSAAYFDGVDDSVTVASTSTLHFEDKDFTVAFWANWKGGDGEFLRLDDVWRLDSADLSSRTHCFNSCIHVYLFKTEKKTT